MAFCGFSHHKTNKLATFVFQACPTCKGLYINTLKCIEICHIISSKIHKNMQYIWDMEETLFLFI